MHEVISYEYQHLFESVMYYIKVQLLQFWHYVDIICNDSGSYCRGCCYS